MKAKVVSVFSAAFLLCNVAHAEEVNTADISREAARQAAGESEPVKVDEVEVTGTEIEETDVEDVIKETFELKGINIDSDIKEIGYEEVQHIIEPYVNEEVNINSLKKLALEIKDYCRQKGWLAAVAYLPEQDSTDGVVTIKIMSPNFGKVTINNQSHLADDILKKVGENISSKHLVQNHKIENVLYLINEIGGVRARGALIPDTLTRTVGLNINVVDDQTKRGIAYYENYGSKSTARYRLGALYDIYNIDNRGSRLEVSGLMARNRNLDNFSVDYSWITDRKTTSRAGLSFGRTTYYQVPSGFGSDLYSVNAEAGGHSTDFRLYGMTPIWKTIHDGFVWNYGYKFRDYTQTVDTTIRYNQILHDVLGLSDTVIHYPDDRYIHTLSLGVSGYKRSLFNDLFNYSFTLYGGHVSPQSDYAETMADLKEDGGNFFRSVANVDYRKLFNKYIEFHTNLTLQNASKNLVGAEQLTIGGAHGVRGYGDGEGSGDEGYLSRSEVIYHTDMPGLSLSVFFDIGGAGIKSEHDIHTIRSWGFEANYSKQNDFFIKLDYARKLGSNNLLVARDDKRQRFWFMVGKIF